MPCEGGGRVCKPGIEEFNSEEPRSADGAVVMEVVMEEGGGCCSAGET